MRLHYVAFYMLRLHLLSELGKYFFLFLFMLFLLFLFYASYPPASRMPSFKSTATTKTS